MSVPLLEVRDLRVTFGHGPGRFEAVSGVSFGVAPGEVLGVVGESGSGKSATAMALARLNEGPQTQLSGEILLEGRDILGLTPTELREMRGKGIAMVFQDAMTALNPCETIGDQIAEAITVHGEAGRRAARKRAVALLGEVGIPEPERRAGQYPHEVSGGQRQRAMIALALACDPKLLIADEPTTALDVTIQAQILALLKTLVTRRGMGLILITHDLAVVAGVAERVAVMYRGHIVEEAPVETIFAAPRHAHTRELIAAATLPPAHATEPNTAPPLLSLRGLTVRYPVRDGLFARRDITALAPTDLDIRKGEVLAIVGESGSGKTTLGRAMLRLVKASGGAILHGTDDLMTVSPRAMSALRPRFQMVFQDPYSSLNPRRRVGHIIGDVLGHVGVPKAERRDRAAGLLADVGLQADALDRFPAAFSGGQRQRIAIARALASEPELVVADEPVSALDVTIQAQVVELLIALKRERGLTLVFISHDLGLVSAIADRIVVMYHGEIVEITDPAGLGAPAHAYTRSLLASQPRPDVAAARQTLASAASNIEAAERATA